MTVDDYSSRNQPLWTAIRALLGDQKGGTPMRPEQLEYSGRVDEAIRRGNGGHTPNPTKFVTLLEADTGVGKTLGYLAPAALFAATKGHRVLIGTSTLNLMRQIMQAGGDGQIAIDAVRSATNKTIVIAQDRGSRNFVDATRTESYAKMLRNDGNFAMALQYLGIAAEVRDQQKRAAKILDDIDNNKMVPHDANQVVAAGLVDAYNSDTIGGKPGIDDNRLDIADLAAEDICLHQNSSAADSVIYRLSVTLAELADIVVTTHAKVARKLMMRQLPPGHDKEKTQTYGVLILDEADRWRDAAASTSAVSISLEALSRRVGNLMAVGSKTPLHKAIGNAGADIIASIDDLAHLAPKTAGTVAELSGDAIVAAESILSKLRTMTKAADKVLDTTASPLGHVKSIGNDISLLLSRADKSAPGKNTPDKFWRLRWETSAKHGKPSLTVACVMPGRMLRRVWNTTTKNDREEGVERPPLARAIILTSATLCTPNLQQGSDSHGTAGSWGDIEAATGLTADYKDAHGKDIREDVVDRELSAIIHPANHGTLHVRVAHPAAPSQRKKGKNAPRDPDAIAYAATVIERARATPKPNGRPAKTLVLVPGYADVADLAPHLDPKNLLLHAAGTSLRALERQYLTTTGDACIVTPAAWFGVDWPGFVDHVVMPTLPFFRNSDDPDDDPDHKGARSHRDWAHMVSKAIQGIGRFPRRRDDFAVFWCADPDLPVPRELTERLLLASPPKGKGHSNNVNLAIIRPRWRRLWARNPESIDIAAPWPLPNSQE